MKLGRTFMMYAPTVFLPATFLLTTSCWAGSAPRLVGCSSPPFAAPSSRLTPYSRSTRSSNPGYWYAFWVDVPRVLLTLGCLRSARPRDFRPSRVHSRRDGACLVSPAHHFHPHLNLLLPSRSSRLETQPRTRARSRSVSRPPSASFGTEPSPP